MKILITKFCEIPDIYCSDRCSPTFMEDSIISVSGDENTVNIWKPNAVYDTRTCLVEHKQKINAFAVSPKKHNFVCTCSNDKIILWRINTENSTSPVGLTFAFDSGIIDYCTFNSDEEWLALCRENEILIIKIQLCEGEDVDFDVLHHATLETNSSSGNQCVFSPLNKEIIITTEDSSYFKVWNFVYVTLLYKSPKLGTYSITHCSFANDPPYLFLGTNGPIVHVYKCKQNNIPKQLINLNIGKTFLCEDENFAVSNTDNSTKKKYSNASVQLSEDCGKVGCITFGVYVFKREAKYETEGTCDASDVSDFVNLNDQTLKSILCPTSVIAVCCNLGIALFNCNSWECESVLRMADMLPGTSLSPEALPLLSFLVIRGDSLDNFSCMLKMSLNGGKLYILELSVMDAYIQGAEDGICQKSVVPLEPVAKSSPLRFQMASVTNTRVSPYSSKEVKLKSSGYGKPSKSQMFFPVINKRKDGCQNRKSASTAKKKLESSHSVLDFISSKSAVSGIGPPTKAGRKFCILDTTGTEMQLAVTGDGENLACSSTASYICVVKSSDMDPDKGLNLLGHNGAVNSVHFSFNSQWLISTSCDATMKVWDWRRKKCIFNINRSVLNHKGASATNKQDGNKNLISEARFYYMDQFLLAASQDALEMYAHLLHEIDSGHVPENLRRNKKVCEMKVPAQQITCFSAANKFFSYVILCCCSNRSLQVYDMNVQKCVVQLDNIHLRPAHHMKQMEGSRAHAHPPGMYNLFITTAVCDSTKLWDLRSGRCIQKYCQHVNRAYSSGIDISPCGCYVATGSEDKFVYLYDTRKCSDYLLKLGGLGETVMDVSFNPCKPILAAAALNGCITSFSAL